VSRPRQNLSSELLALLLIVLGLVFVSGCGPLAGPAKPPSDLYKEAQSHEEKGTEAEKAAAIKVYAKIVTAYGKSEESKEAYARLIALHKERKEYDKAVDYARRRIRSLPDSKEQPQWRSELLALRQERDHYNATGHKYAVLYRLMDSLVALTGRHRSYSYALAVILLAVIIKLVLTPFANMQFRAMKDQARVSPIIKQLQEQYKDDRQRLNQEIMKAYKEHNINIAASCLPMVVMIVPLYFIYIGIRMYEYQFSKGSFLWIPDLSAVDIPLMVIYAVSMLISQWFMVIDPTQMRQQTMLSVFMTIMIVWWTVQYQWPAAFILYWLAFNVVTTAQQIYMMRKYDIRAVIAESHAKAQEIAKQKPKPSDAGPEPSTASGLQVSSSGAEPQTENPGRGRGPTPPKHRRRRKGK
jgi:YidC/Oxa1 family membrane protein insertase